MPYLIDSDVVIDHLKDEPTSVALLTLLAPQGIAISVITYLEAYQGLLRGPDSVEAQARFDTLLESLPVLPLSLPVARRCALLREELTKSDKRVRSRAFDLLIAATALEPA